MPNNIVFSNPGGSVIRWGNGAATPYLTLSGLPSTGTVGVAVSGLVTNTSAATATWTVSSSPADAIVTPSSGTLAPGVAVAFTLTALASGLKNVQLTSTTPNTIISGSPHSFTAASVAPPPPPPAPAASALTLSMASTGTTGSATLVTVTPNAAIGATGTATLSVSGGGTLGTSTLNFTAGSSAAQSTTLTRTTDGTTTLTMTNNMGLSNLGSPASYGSTSAASTGTPQPFTLTSASSGILPFAIGYAMSQGHVPAGQSLSFSGATAKLTVLSTWPDGSARHGIIAGTYTSAGAVTVTPTVATVTAGTALTGVAVQTAMGANTAVFDAGAFGSATFSGADFATPFVTHAATDAFIEAIYRKQIGSDAHLVAWLSLRVWSSGAVEALPWIENGYLTVAGPTNKSATYSFTLGGTSRFSAAIDIKHHTRIPLLTGSTFAYWLGTDPAVTFAHNAAYLMATKLVPNYGFGTPSTTALNALQQTYTPNDLAGVNPAMGAAGGSAALISNPQAMYVASGGDSRAFKAAMVYGFSGGSWSVHYRDEVTNLPLDLVDYPGISLQGGTPSIPSPSGTTNGTASVTHQPSFGYLPYLLTGRYWFMEESQFWCGYNFMSADVESRRGRVAFGTGPYLFTTGAGGVIDPRAGTYANRGAHWSIRTLAQTLAITPTSHANAAGYQSVWENNTNFYNAVFVTGTHAPGWVSPQGFLGDYSSSGDALYGQIGGVNAWFGAGWMSTFGVQAWAFASNLGLTQSTDSLGRMNAVRNHAYKQVITRAGDGAGSNYNWRRFIVYSYPFGSDGVGLPVDSMYTGAQSYADLLTAFSLSSIAATEGLSLKNHSADTDLTAGSSVDYGSFGLAALAYAVDHDAPGAAEGWLRVAGASNFNVFDSLQDAPEHGIKPIDDPALPAWVPAPGASAIINLNSLAALNPCPADNCWYSQSSKQQAAWRNWNGAAYASGYSEHGAMVFWGGGHGGGEDISLYCFDFTTRNWSRIGPSNPTSDFTGASGYLALDSTYYDYLHEGSYIVPGLHTYGYPFYVPPGMPGVGAKGAWGLAHLVGGPTSGSVPHQVDLDTGVWTRMTNGKNAAGASPYAGAFVDTTRGKVWWESLDSSNLNGMNLNDAVPRTMSRISVSSFAYGFYYPRYIYVPEADQAIGIGCYYGSRQLRAEVFDLSSGQPVQMGGHTFGTTYLLPLLVNGENPNGSGVDWCPITQAFYLYSGYGSTTVHKLKPSSLNFYTATWTITTETFSSPVWEGGSANTAQGAQPFSRWAYIPSLRCFAWCDGPNVSAANTATGISNSGAMQLWRPAGT